MAEYVPTFLGSVMKAIACTPNKNFDNDAYDKGVIEPAAKIRKLQEELEDQRPSDSQMKEVMILLLTIFDTKMVDMEEREDRIRETLDRTQCHDVFPNLLPLKKDLQSQIEQVGIEATSEQGPEEASMPEASRQLDEAVADAAVTNPEGDANQPGETVFVESIEIESESDGSIITESVVIESVEIESATDEPDEAATVEPESEPNVDPSSERADEA